MYEFLLDYGSLSNFLYSLERLDTVDSKVIFCLQNQDFLVYNLFYMPSDIKYFDEGICF